MKGMKPVKVWSGEDRVQADMITLTLNEHGIPAYSESKGSGDYMNIYMGMSVFGNDIYVDEKDLKDAREIITALTMENEEIDGTGEKIYVASARRSVRAVRVISLLAAIVMIIGAVAPSIADILFG